MIYRVSSAHEEGGERVYAASTEEFVGDANGAVRALRLTEVAFDGGRFAPVPGSRREIPCDLVLLAMGFTGAEKPGLLVRPRRRRSTRAATWPATPPTRRRCPACSWPATWAAASR